MTRGPVCPPHRIAAVRALAANGRNASQIGRAIGMSGRGVAALARREGIALPTASEAAVARWRDPARRAAQSARMREAYGAPRHVGMGRAS